MSVVTIKLDNGYFTDLLGSEASKLVPESVILDAESNMERYLTNHSQEFWNELNSAIEKAVEDNHALLTAAGAVEDSEDENDDEE